MVTSVRLSMFGNVGMVRAVCEHCETTALIVDGEIQCCGRQVKVEAKRWERIVEPEFQRRRPSKDEQAMCLFRQSDCCLYCEQPFGSSTHHHGRPVVLRVCWDHFVPYSYSANNSDANFVAACQICNGYKSDLIFDSVEKAQVYIATRREAKGTTPEKTVRWM